MTLVSRLDAHTASYCIKIARSRYSSIAITILDPEFSRAKIVSFNTSMAMTILDKEEPLLGTELKLNQATLINPA